MLIRELPWRPPHQVASCWADDPRLAWLDGGGAAGPRRRTSYLAIDPFRLLRAGPDGTSLDGRPLDLDPFSALKRELDLFSAQEPPEEPIPVPFSGGAVGLLGYELGGHLAPVPVPRLGRLDMPDLSFGFYDLVFGFDLDARRCWLMSSGKPETGGAARRHAADRAAWAMRRLDGITPPAATIAVPPLRWKRETPRERHRQQVERVRDLIAAGDIYQANLTNRFLAETPSGLRPFDLYMKLRSANPAPFSAFLGCGPDTAVASVSPERFLRLHRNGSIESRPLKGTRPRDASPERDAALAAELANSAKDRAENLMIVDLLRNDIGRVARFGSVRVSSLQAVESFASVHHMVSAIEGTLQPGLGAVDLLRAAFPGGSITGAPKIRAMQIIAELEAAPRGPYCGSVAWIGFDGAMDSSIAIRTVAVTPNVIAAQAGGGIVFDSDPAAEFEEMMHKIRPILRTVGEEPA